MSESGIKRLAFPAIEIVETGKEKAYVYHTGMQLRDYFAAKAMQAILTISRGAVKGTNEEAVEYLESIPSGAYHIADLMMKERDK